MPQGNIFNYTELYISQPYLKNILKKTTRSSARRTILAISLLISFGAVSAHSLPGAPSQEVFAQDRIVVIPREGLSPESLEHILKPHGGKAYKLGQSNIHVVSLGRGVSAAAAVAALTANPHIKSAHLDRIVHAGAIPNDPYYGAAYHLPLIGAPAAWNTTFGEGVTIAILDSGVDATHPDLQPNLIPGYSLVNGNADTSDVCGHGTAVAGTAAAAINNGVGVSGISGHSKIMPLGVASYDATNGCYAYSSTIANAVTYAADHGARIANVSYGPLAGDSTVQNAGNYFQSKNGLLFLSAGNAGTDLAVAPSTAFIVVSATDSTDTKTSWSSYGSAVSLAAPGAGIYTTSKGGSYQQWNGTSFSSPLAAGVAALMMSANPKLDNLTIQKILFSTAADLGAPGRDPYYGYGRVDAGKAVAAAVAYAAPVDTTPPAVAITSPNASATVSGLVPVNVAASDNVGVTHVDLKVNNTIVASDTSAPYEFSWNSNGVPNGMASLTAVAYDVAGNVASSQVIQVNVANVVTLPPPVKDTIAPVVNITNPVSGVISGTVTVKTSASDNSGASGITQVLSIDGVVKAQGVGASLSYRWASSLQPPGSTHLISVTAQDKAGNVGTSSVTVQTAAARKR